MDARKKDRLIQKLCTFIPTHISNQTVTMVLEWMCRFERLKKEKNQQQMSRMEACITHMELATARGGYIEDQNKWTDVPFGICTMQYSGCEVIATYNALHYLMGEAVPTISEIIAAFERDGILRAGKFGVSPKAIARYVKKQGFRVIFSAKQNRILEIAKEADTSILTFYNDRVDLAKQIHTISITKEKGGFVAHNVCGNGVAEGPFDSVAELMQTIRGGNAGAIAISGIYR